ncbi:sulfotransferase family 2 domain-containing protein [Microbulbifer sp. YPW16]|uniref:sulfotransferase family 2 domain-containing protein n=1 Tax=Microbulbifer sp. YPW16 TaxID=2904242 RepID=UPI001E5C0D08|nr:sulfotransferase family 2 domain-containing protein [Microbulbifer sp. YPW16]UHQ55864.1 sulfotransferase family 2 domain-containing protein [Microbulbifer sp. YPW16]
MRLVITHGHIFKNAGTTFDWALRRYFGDAFCDHRDDMPMRSRGVEYLQEFLEENPGIQALSSHHMCNTSGLEGIKSLPVFFLRHPLLRALSVYSFERKQNSETPGAKAAKKYSFKDYVQWRMEPKVGRTIRDYQVAYLASGPKVSNARNVGLNHLSSAAKRFGDGSLVGLVEDFDRSMTVIEQELGKHFPNIDLSYLRQNTGRAVKGEQRNINYIANELGEVFDLLVENNSFDLALYRMAKDSLEKKVDKTDNFDALLADYRARCEALSEDKKRA